MLTGEDGLTELLVVMNFLNETGSADPKVIRLNVHVFPKILTPFQLENLAVLTGFHGADVRAWGVRYVRTFEMVSLINLPLIPDKMVTSGSVLTAVGLLQYGLDTEEPDVPLPATQRCSTGPTCWGQRGGPG